MKKILIIFCFIFFNLRYANAEIEITRWMAENRPDIPIFINSHTSGGQITPHYK